VHLVLCFLATCISMSPAAVRFQRTSGVLILTHLCDSLVCSSHHLQLPVFVTAMWAARRMAADNWPGLTTGGAAWFPDLTAPALDLSATFIQQVAPLGTLGAVLPLAVTAAMFTNVGLAFGNISKGQTRSVPFPPTPSLLPPPPSLHTSPPFLLPPTSSP
jgi:hypothetical protein